MTSIIDSKTKPRQNNGPMMGRVYWACTALLIISWCTPVIAYAMIIDLGIRGKQYPIVEKNALAEIQQRAANVDWKTKISKDKLQQRATYYKPSNLVRLPKATTTSARLVDITYTLPYDIPKVDAKGNQDGILYPKGYRFNPLKYMPTYDGILVFIDASDKDQVAWLRKTPYLNDYRAKILLTDGDYYSLAQSLWHPVYYATEPIITRFQIKAVPSVVFQAGDFMKVHEVNIYAKSKNQ